MIDRHEMAQIRLREHLLDAYLEAQERLQNEGVIPGAGAERRRFVLEAIAGIQIGLLIACVTVLGVFVVANTMFHLEF